MLSENRKYWFFALFAVVTFGGVFLVYQGAVLSGEPADQETPAPSSFGACDFHYPNGSQILCKNHATLVPVFDEAPGHALCVSRFTIQDYRLELRWDPIRRALGIFFSGARTWNNGYVLVDSSAGETMFSWRDSKESGYVPLNVGVPLQVDQDVHLVVSQYETSFSINQSQEGLFSLSELWSPYDGRAWLVYALEGPTETLFFDGILQVPAQGTTLLYPKSTHSDGPEFDLSMNFSSPGSFGFVASETGSCTLR